MTDTYTCSTDDSNVARLWLNAADWVATVRDFDEWLRGKVKHLGHDDWPYADAIRTELLTRLTNQGLFLDD